MFCDFRQTFLESKFDRWGGMGLVIESASAKVAERAFPRLRDVLPYGEFDLLSKRERPGLGFRNMFRVKRPLGGLRLLLKARKDYDLVVFFATGERQLFLCRTFAVLLMRPQRFFVFNKFGDGYWLDREHWPSLRMHLEMRYHWEKRWKRFVAALRALGRAVVWLAWLPVRIPLVLYAGLFFLAALLLLAVLRTTYDPYSYRYRFFGKTAAAPRR